MPGEVVVAEVDPADVGDRAVHQDQLLVVARGQVPIESAEWIDELHAHAISLEPCHQHIGLTPLLMDRVVERMPRVSQPAVAHHVLRKTIDDQTPVGRGRLQDRLGEGSTRGVALEGQRLHEHALARGGQIDTEGVHELG